MNHARFHLLPHFNHKTGSLNDKLVFHKHAHILTVCIYQSLECARL